MPLVFYFKRKIEHELVAYKISEKRTFKNMTHDKDQRCSWLVLGAGRSHIRSFYCCLPGSLGTLWSRLLSPPARARRTHGQKFPRRLLHTHMNNLSTLPSPSTPQLKLTFPILKWCNRENGANLCTFRFARVCRHTAELLPQRCPSAMLQQNSMSLSFLTVPIFLLPSLTESCLNISSKQKNLQDKRTDDEVKDIKNASIREDQMINKAI